MPEHRAIGEPTAEYHTMELGRSLPRLLDSRRADGGVMRLLTDPGGKVGPSTIRDDSPSGSAVVTASALDRVKLLYQQPAELDEDFNIRALLAPFRSAYWHAMDYLASRPYADGLTVEGKAVAAELEVGGEWHEDIDGHGNDTLTFLQSHSREATGYGWGAIWTKERNGRGVWRWIGAESITSVEPGPDGPSSVDVVAEVAPDGDLSGGEYVLHFTSAIRSGRDFASVAFHKKKGQGKFDQKPEDVRELAPHVSIPIDPLPASILTSTWFSLPLLLPAAKLDHLLLQISSQIAYAAMQSLTFLRFVKGLTDQTELDDWAAAGPRVFYGTTGTNADMKWVTVPIGAIEGGIAFEDHILRGIEVAGLAPMMTRMPGDEKATGMSIAAARARSGAEAIAKMFESQSTQAYRRLAMHTSRRDADVQDMPRIVLATEFSASAANMAAADLVARIYLDPKAGMERPEFWEQMIRYGIAAEGADIEALTMWAERANPERARAQTDKAKVLLEAASEGLMIGSPEGRAAIYAGLIEHGIIPKSTIPDGNTEKFIKTLVDADEEAGRLVGSGLKPAKQEARGT